MRLWLFVIHLYLGALIGNSGGTILGRWLHASSTTTSTEKPRSPHFINNNLPHVEVNCTAHYACSKKLTSLPAPRPCVKYCLKRIECPNSLKIRGKPSECVELDESQVLTEYEATTSKSAPGEPTTEKIMEVAMIDFPCQPGYLPDSRGRCREIW